MMNHKLRNVAVLIGLAVVVRTLLPLPVYAHGFGDRYDLPVPLWLYITGAGASVAFSFVVIGLYMRASPGRTSYPRLNLLRWSAGRALAHPILLQVVKAAFVALFVGTIAAGILGNQNPSRNLAPTMVWVIWWVGMAYISAFVGNIWVVLNPWKTIFEWADGLFKRVNSGDELSLNASYPKRLGVWPGVVLFAAFAWVEIVFQGSAEPRTLSIFALLYSLITWMGMLIYGKHQWLRHGESFSLVFGYLSRLAPTELRVKGVEIDCPDEFLNSEGSCVDDYEEFELASQDAKQWNLRPPAAGLLHAGGVSASQMAFVLLLLSTVTFDGFTATPFWNKVLLNTYQDFSFLGEHAVSGVTTAGLMVFPLLFLVVYLGFTLAMKLASGGTMELGQLARAFVYSLIPIALAYHLAHFFSFLLVQGQLIIPLVSDPLGIGWDLFSTTGYSTNIGVINAKFAWFLGVGTIVAGHIAAVYVAHLYAATLFPDRRSALHSQYPMLLLMVGYTMISLWILAQPIVEFTSGR